MTATDPANAAQVPLSKIRTGDNPRRHFNQQKHDELVISLRLRGLLQPILLRPARDVEDEFTIVVGERRYRAALEAFGPDANVSATIRDLTDQEALEAAIDENDAREDASETEQADAAVRVLAACGDDHAEAARRLGWSPSKLARRLALSKLTETVKTALDERRIKVGHAELLAVVPPDKQDTALQAILTAGLDVARTRAALMRMTHSLDHATFDRAECGACPYNSASQQALFATHVDDGHCTNPGCFQLKTDAAEAAKAAAQPETISNSGAASAGPKPGGDAGSTAEQSTPDSAPGSSPDEGRVSPKPMAKATPAAAERKPAINSASIAARVAEQREAAWRQAVGDAIAGDTPLSTQADRELRAFALTAIDRAVTFEHVADLARALDIDLRASWKVDGTFLGRFDKDQLRFIALECGLVAHMGEKAFAALLKHKPDAIAALMANATGFDWAGRLPSSMTLDGAYGPPPVFTSPIVPASTTAED